MEILFLKAAIPGGAVRDLFAAPILAAPVLSAPVLAAPVTVASHVTRAGTFVQPYEAIRHKRLVAPELDKRGLALVQLHATRANLARDLATLHRREQAVHREAEEHARALEPGRGQFFGRDATTWTVRQEGWYQAKRAELVEREAPSARALLVRTDRLAAQAGEQARKLGINEPWRPEHQGAGASFRDDPSVPGEHVGSKVAPQPLGPTPRQARLTEWADTALEAEGDFWKPARHATPQPLYRSVSRNGLQDLIDKGAVHGKGNTFSDARRHVFFAASMDASTIRQGEELERQAHVALASSPEAMAVVAAMGRRDQLDAAVKQANKDPLPPGAARKAAIRAYSMLAADAWDAGQAVRDAETAYRQASNAWIVAKRAANKNVAFTSAVLETAPMAGGLHYSYAHGMSGMKADEYAFPHGHVTAGDVTRVHLVKDGKPVAVVSLEEAARRLAGTG